MAVLKLKPHVLEYKITSKGYEDSNGDFHEGASTWEVTFHVMQYLQTGSQMR